VTHPFSLCRAVMFMMTVMSNLAIAPSAGAQPQSTESVFERPELRLTLKEAIDIALNNNPNVRLYKEKIEGARGAVITQFGAMMPNLSSNVRQSHQTLFLGTLGLAPVRTNPFSIFDARVNASQNLFSVSLIQRWRASREALKVAELESEGAKADAISSVALLYTEVLKAEASVKMREANLQVFNELLAFVRRRQGGGMATGLDAARLESQMENERQQLTAARAEVERIKLNLTNALGIMIDVKLTLEDELKADVGDLPVAEFVLESAVANRPEVQAQAKRIKSAELSYSSTTGERLPSLVAQGDYGLIGNRMHNTLDTYNMALMLQVPIFDGAQREGRISEARSALQQEAIKLQGIINQVKMEVREALVTMQAAKEQVTISQGGMKAALKELQLARERFAVLTAANNLEVTNALYSVARARDNFVEALFRLNAARVHLARAQGRLDLLY